MKKDVSINKTDSSIYCKCSLEHNREAMRALSGSGYYLYTYFVQNQDGYVFQLRRTHVMNVTGLSQSAYYRALQELLDKGYLVKDDEGYEFYEAPLDI